MTFDVGLSGALAQQIYTYYDYSHLKFYKYTLYMCCFHSSPSKLCLEPSSEYSGSPVTLSVSSDVLLCLRLVC